MTLKTERLSRDERWQLIRNLLDNRPLVLISELATDFSVSVETIRRDIDAMAEAGLVERTYGGATAFNTAREPAINQRTTLLSEERKKMAQTVSSHVRDGEVLMIDSSATCLPLVQRLVVERRNLKIITNSFPVASAAAYNTTFKVIMAGGSYNASEGANYGSEATEFLRRFTADYCFSSCAAVTLEGPSEVDSDIAAVKRVMFSRSRKVVLLVDHDKYRASKLELVSGLNALDLLVTDQPLPASLKQALVNADVKCLVAD
jgi:DeoR/GlpR family transcriptional regulator of sugar metabolism